MVKPYVKRGKTDAADAEAICEAVTRPTMRFVAVKSVEQQAVLMLHKSRDLTVRQRTMHSQRFQRPIMIRDRRYAPMTMLRDPERRGRCAFVP